MTKQELRKQVMESNCAGDFIKETEELRKVQKEKPEDISSLSATCSGFLSLICC